MRPGFPGFPNEAMTFYRGLARNNKREWFQPRKHIYDEQVKAPMVELVAELNSAMMDFAPDYVTDAAQAIYRIYRDTRFSPDKTPYKTQIAASFARRGMEKHGAGGFYFAIRTKAWMWAAEFICRNRNAAGGACAHRGTARGVPQAGGGAGHRRLLGAIFGRGVARVPMVFGRHPAADLLRLNSFCFSLRWTRRL